MPMQPNFPKPPIYLLDSMAFIFRAYHAMQRQRPMSTRTGIPTAATYVFVNMINKLRKDFSPQYLAAIYDVGAPVHRNELATQLKDVQKFNIKTQAFETIEYGGYKANRVETPPDLIQQQPHIRRALEAFRIPILYYEGFEADDVIGTLSHPLMCILAAVLSGLLHPCAVEEDQLPHPVLLLHNRGFQPLGWRRFARSGHLD